MRNTVLLGNIHPMMQIKAPDGKQIGVRAAHLEQSITRVVFWEGIDDLKMVKHALSTDNDRDLIARAALLGKKHERYALVVHELEDLMKVHTAGHRPAWVACEDERIQKTLADYFSCDQGESKMVRTNAGRDALIAQHYDIGAQPAAFGYGALSANTGSAFAATDTTLSGEITTNGLGRATMTYAHTAGTNTATLTKTWTYTGSTSVTLASLATFNASSAGTMDDEDILSSNVTVTTNGDTITVTFTFTVN